MRDKLGIGTVKCSLFRGFINCKLSSNNGIEQLRSIKFYEFCVLRRGSKEELLLTSVLTVQLNDSKSCIVSFCYCSFTGVFKVLQANFLPSSYFSTNFLVRAGKMLFNIGSQTKK